ncbi:MAG: tryptophan--tRNA ligase [Clostridia bacterium]|nr:tryptophan--tRNA ligase [Clostridia bacterium]
MKKVVFSGVQPTGKLTLGNYLGAIRNWGQFQDDYECIYCVVDLHSITVKRVPAELRRQTYETLALYIACGIDPQKSILFVQSHVPAHAELTWVLNTITYVGEMNRMTQFKDKSSKHADNINMGLMDYPVLMASDILLYKTDLVPIGADQKQHLEIARDIAIRFNAQYSDTFTVPDGYIPKVGAKIMSLQQPTQKMSKSDENEKASIYLLDDADAIVRKFRSAVTDSDGEVRFDEVNKPGISNLLGIYSLLSDKTIDEAEIEFANCGYSVFKDAVADAVIQKLAPIQAEQKRLLDDKDYLTEIMRQGAEKANCLARKTLSKVYRKVGFIQL